MCSLLCQRVERGSGAVRVVFGVEKSKRKTNRPRREGAERLVRGRRAMKPYARGDAERFVQLCRNVCAVARRRLNRHHACPVIHARQPDDFKPSVRLHGLDSFQKALRERQLMRADGIQPRFHQKAQRSVKPRKPRKVHRSGFEPVGQKFRHELGVAHAAGAAREKRRQLLRQFFSQDDAARPLRTEQPLVPRKRDSVYVTRLHINRENTRSLRAVEKEADLMTLAERTDLFDRQQCSADVACVQADKELRVFPHKRFRLRKPECAVRIARNPVKRHTRSFQLPQRTHDGVVLHGRHQHMVPRAQKALEQQIEARCDVRRKDHAARVLAVKERAELLPRLEDELFCAVGSLIAPARDIAAAGGHIPVNSLRHARGFRKAGAGVVEIDGRHTNLSFVFLIVPTIYQECK